MPSCRIARGANRPLAVLYLQIGSFREITEALGYRESDLLLEEIGRRLAGFGPGGPVARVADDAFVFVLVRGDAEAAHGLAQRVLAALAAPIELSGLLLEARASIGITLYPGHGDDAEALLRRAAVVNYQASKTAQRHAFYAGRLDNECPRRLALMGELRRAIADRLAELGCEAVQGYCISRPMPVSQYANWTAGFSWAH